MIKLNGKKETKIAVFISGRGSNLQNLIKYSKNHNSKFKISLIVSNKSKALGLNFAKKFNIKKKIINFNNSKLMEKNLILSLKKEKINIICLAGFMKVLSKNFIKKFNGKILNIHPSLLPKYKGLNTHERAIKNKDRFAGASIHKVTEKLDSGKVILQKKVKILKSDNVRSLEKKVLKIEHEIYPKAIDKFLTNL